MIKYQESLTATVGAVLQPLQGAEVRVIDKATGLPATLYQDDELTAIPQPLITTNTGFFEFKAADGKYTLSFSGARFATFTREIVLEDPADNPFLTAQELALQNGATKIGYGTRTVSDKLGEGVSVKDFGAVGDSVTDDSAAIAAARAELGPNKPLLFPSGKFNSSVVTSPYGGQVDGLHEHIQLGTDAAPATDRSPLILLEKVASAFAEDGNTAPSTALNVLMRQVTGDVGSIAMTGHVEVAGDTAAGGIGVKGRARGRNTTGSIWGGWFYADMANQGGGVPIRTIGTEINIKNNTGVTPVWESDVGAGSISGLVVATADSVSPGIAHAAIRVSKNTGNGFLTGLQFGVGAIQPSDASLNGEAIFLQGASADANRFGGLRFGYGSNSRFHYALRTSEAAFNNGVAIWLGDNHRIRWGASISSGPYLHYSTAATAMQFVGASLDVAAGSSSKLLLNNLQVLTTRRTGWVNMTGTASRTAYDTTTATAAQVAERLKALIDDLITHGLIGN